MLNSLVATKIIDFTLYFIFNLFRQQNHIMLSTDNLTTPINVIFFKNVILYIVIF